MSEIFEGARKRFKRQVASARLLGEGNVNVRVTVSFEPAAFMAALEWARRKRYTYERDGEIGALLLGALADGVLSSGDYDFDFDEQFDVDVENEE